MIEHVEIWQTLIVLGGGLIMVGVAADMAFYWSRLCFAFWVLGVVLAAAGVFLGANPNLF